MTERSFIDVTEEISNYLRIKLTAQIRPPRITRYTWGKYGMMEATHVIRMHIGYGMKKIAEVHHTNMQGYTPRIRVYSNNEIIESVIESAVNKLKQKGLEIAVDSCF